MPERGFSQVPDVLPRFDPAEGMTVIEPPGSGAGWWAGAPSAVWTGSGWYLSYRLRRPQPERGGTTLIAKSVDGANFTTIWSASKDDFASPSIERSALVRVSDDCWRLYVSYVDGADGRWRIDLLEAATPDGFDPRARRPALTAGGIGVEGVKDPWVTRYAGSWLMIASYAPTPAGGADRVRLHATQDVYNTGLTRSLTGLATSDDGVTWRWEGGILEPRPGRWDAYAARLTTVLRTSDGWLGLYDGSADVAENYEERCGLAVSTDLRTWRRLGDGPLVGAAGGPGTVRYAEAVREASGIRFYYEYTRSDGSHELRTSLVRGEGDDTTGLKRAYYSY